MSALTDTLRRFDIFEGFTDEELAQIVALCREESYDDGDLIFAEDAPAEKLYLILEGKVSLEKRVQLGQSGTRRRATVSVVGADQAMGWSSLIAPHFYTSSGICLEPTRVLVINGEELRQFMARDPAAGYQIMDKTASIVKTRLQNTTAMMTYFLSIVSHELRTPLAAIENYLQVMLGGYAGELTPRQRRMMQRSALRLKDLRSLIGDVLDLARMRPEEIHADFEWFDPVEIGTEAIEDVRMAADEKAITLKATGPAQFRRMVGAPRRLRQVISNLLSNAVKFSPEGSTVTLRAVDEPDRLVIEVTDEGMGIPTEDQAHIFDDFFRGRNAAEVGGAGLGLSIARKIVDAHRGQIWVESPYAEGKPGTKFTVVIPRNLLTPEMKRP